MKRILDSIKNNMDNKNYYGALYISLSLIDACAKIEFPHLSNRVNKIRYTSWLNKYFIPLFERDCAKPIIPSEAIYDLRCSVLHESTNIIKNKNSNLYKIILVASQSHRNVATITFGKQSVREIVASVVTFVNEIIESIEKWMKTKSDIETLLDFAIETGEWSSTTFGNTTIFKDCK